jgi:hypothetical protein
MTPNNMYLQAQRHQEKVKAEHMERTLTSILTVLVKIDKKLDRLVEVLAKEP